VQLALADLDKTLWQQPRPDVLNVVKYKVFVESAPVEPPTFDVLALLENKLVEENVFRDAEEGTAG
jgi:hypothetical protein